MHWNETGIDFWAPPTTDAPTAAAVTPPVEQYGIWGGDKYHGGFGPTQLFDLDYWTLRQRSGQLFRENMYARGLLRRMVTNEINTGLSLEAKPEGLILGIDDDKLEDWSEEVETRFELWGKNARLCDYFGERTFGALQRHLRFESLVDGDVLVLLDVDRVTGLPKVRLVNANRVRTPLDDTGRRETHTIVHGVELDKNNRQVAYWVDQDDGTSKRVPRYGPRSGRRVAWLVYGTERRMDDVRGEPILALILQSLKEVDRYRDAALRKAVINSVLAMFIQKDEDKIGTLPMIGGATRRDEVAPVDNSNASRTYDITKYLPGTIIQELQVGEKPVPHSTAGTDVNFQPFEEAMIHAFAWVNEYPPEIMKLMFSSNYAASQGAIKELKIYLNMRRTDYSENFNQPVYVEWFVSSVLQRAIEAQGLLEAWRDPRQHDVFGAWVMAEWCGAIKPTTDPVKEAKAYQIMVAEGWITNARVARELTGTKFSKNIKQLLKENEQKAEALVPLAEPVEDTPNPDEVIGAVLEAIG
jgi:lambda family phage portal protein